MKMPRFHHVILLMLCLTGCSKSGPPLSSSPPNTEYFLFVAQGLPKEMMGEVGQQFQELIGEQSTPGDVIHVITTPEHQPITSFEIPEGERNTRLRHRSIRSELGKLLPLFTGQNSSQHGDVQFPVIATTVSALRKTTFPCRVIVIGSPIYNDPRQAGWSMQHGVIPTDGALDAERSPFRTESHFPEETQLTWLAPEPDWGMDAAHREAVTRFLRLYYQEHQGTLVRMATDPASAFRFDPPQFTDVITKREERPGVKVVSGLSKRADTQIDTENIEFEAPTPSPTPEPVAPVIVPDQPVNPAPLPAPTPQPQKPETAEEVLNRVQQDTDRIAIAMNWESSKPCDLDLWISSRGVNEELSYRLKETSFGKLHRDVMRTGSVNADSGEYQNWEWAEVSHSDLGALKLWINAHSAASPVTIKVVIVANGIRREKLVRMNVTKGDGAASSGTRHQSSAWLKVDLTN